MVIIPSMFVVEYPVGAANVNENGVRLKGIVSIKEEYTIKFICALFSAVS